MTGPAAKVPGLRSAHASALDTVEIYNLGAKLGHIIRLLNEIYSALDGKIKAQYFDLDLV